MKTDLFIRMQRRAQGGMTLIELMVGVVVALVAVLVIAQTLLVSEGQKRTTTSGADAQVNGTLALYTVQRDLQGAGYGLTSVMGSLGCEIRASLNGASFSWTLAPLVITAGVDGAPDTIQVLTSNKNNYSVPALIIKDHPNSAANFFVNSAVGIVDGDMMLAVPETPDAANWCTVIQVTNTNAGAGQGLGNNQVQHNPGLSVWNPPGGHNIFPADGYNSGAYLMNLGQFISRTYSITAAQNLRLSTFNTANPVAVVDDLFPNIVQLKAFYGKDTNNDDVVDRYDTTTPTNQAGWSQVLTVRLAVVARSTQYERETVTSANPLWDVGTAATFPGGTTDCGSSKCVSIKVDTITDWGHYRYKVYETTVPLRNMLWHL